MQAIRWVTPSGKFAKLHILIYHRVLPRYDPLRPDEMTRSRFKQHLDCLRRHFQVLALPEAFARLQEGTLPNNAVCITFDDGYQDNIDVALPLLQAYGFSASFFIATGFLNEKLMFNDLIIESIRDCHQVVMIDDEAYANSSSADKRLLIQALIQKIKPLPHEERYRQLNALMPTFALEPLMMTTQGVRQLHRAGMHIGAHTVDHPLLSQCDDEQALIQIKTSKRTLEDIIQDEVRWFAYPNGKYGWDFTATHKNMLRRLNFTGALATDKGLCKRGGDAYALPRYTPWQPQPLRWLTAMLSARLAS